VSALVPPLVVGGVFVAGIAWLVRSETHAKAAEHAERKSAGGSSLPE
jgi:hypothetical protein